MASALRVWRSCTSSGSIALRWLSTVVRCWLSSSAEAAPLS